MTNVSGTPLTADLLFQKLELAIHEHRLAPGTKLGEDDLADVYGVSRTIVRAALQSLSHERLVELKWRNCKRTSTQNTKRFTLVITAAPCICLGSFTSISRVSQIKTPFRR